MVLKLLRMKCLIKLREVITKSVLSHFKLRLHLAKKTDVQITPENKGLNKFVKKEERNALVNICTILKKSFLNWIHIFQIRAQKRRLLSARRKK